MAAVHPSGHQASAARHLPRLAADNGPPLLLGQLGHRAGHGQQSGQAQYVGKETDDAEDGSCGRAVAICADGGSSSLHCALRFRVRLVGSGRSVTSRGAHVCLDL